MAEEPKRRRRTEKPWQLSVVARRYGVSVAKLREYCEQEKIPAKQTSGGQWRIVLPLSPKAVHLLSRNKRRAAIRRMFGDAKVGQPVGDFKPDEALEVIEKILSCELDPFRETNDN